MERTGRFHQGIGYISSVLKADGHQTSLLHITKNVGKKELSEEIKRSKADLIAFSSTTHQYPLVQKYSGWIKEETEIPIICGGVHATICPDQVLSSKGIDMVCIGEGEYPMLELARKLEKGESIYGIKNLWIKKPDGTVKKNSVRPLISNLDELPFPDREIFNFKELSKKWLLSSIGSIAEFVAGRGCPFSCTYCCNPVIRKIYKGKGEYVRIRSVGNVLAEIRRVIENYSPDRILFHDDTFTLFHQWIKEFCEKYPKEFDLPFWCNIRVETVNRQILLNLKKAGCEQINIGIESGNEWLRRTVLNRPMTNQQIMKVFRIAHEVGLRTLSFNMVGIPFETPRMVKDTIELNKLVQPDLIQVSIFYPYPNTELWKLCKKNRFLKQTHVYSYYEDHSVLDLPTMSSEQITQFYYNFVDLCLEKSMETYHPVIYKCFRPLLGPKVLRTLRKARNMFRRWGL
jgi:radical SAM superfamily enzyme YgiQ (UPF0313 family)